MADADKEKAEKLAAAKKRFEQLKKEKAQGGKGKAKGKKTGDKSEKKESTSKAEKDKVDDDHEEQEENAKAEEPESSAVAGADEIDGSKKESKEVDGEEQAKEGENESKDEVPEPEPTSTRAGHGRQPSLSIQSKMRSSSFRKGSVTGGPTSPGRSGQDLPVLSPDGGSVNEIYRKQTIRLEELEKENKRLSKEAETSTTRQRKMEEELEELRENNLQIAELKSRAEKAGGKDDEITKLKTEIASLQRLNKSLQSSSQKGHRASQSVSPQSDLQAQLDSKSSTIEAMELEISNLRAQLSKSTSSSDSSSAQITALEEKLKRAETAAGAAQRELQDVRKNLDRASEKAVKDGSERTSAETKIRSLTKESEERGRQADEALKRAETLEKKLAALTQLHKDADARRQVGEREREKIDKDAAELRKRLGGLEAENARLRDERERARRRDAGGTDDEGLDELEDEDRKKLETRVRELEGELYEMRSGAWRERRMELQPGVDEAVMSPGEKFDEVDLSSGAPRRPSMKHQKGGSFANVLTSGFNAFTGGGEDDGLLEDDDMGFDEEAFRAAQQEDAMKRLERVKEIKRGLKDWEGWRLDLVDLRNTAGGGFGEIFEI